MATSPSDASNKMETVIGYPDPVPGYPATAAAATRHSHGPSLSSSPPPTAQSVNRRRRRCNPYEDSANATTFDIIFCNCLLFLLFSLVLAMFAILIVKPGYPVFQLQSASVSQLNVTRTAITTAAWSFTLLVTNPNKKPHITYESFNASVSYERGQLPVWTALPMPFFKTHETQLTIEFELSALNVYVGEYTANRILQDRNMGGVAFGINVDGWLRFQYGQWRTWRHYIKVFCYPIWIGYSGSNGTRNLMGQPDYCSMFQLYPF